MAEYTVPEMAAKLDQGAQRIRRIVNRFPGHFEPSSRSGRVCRYTHAHTELVRRIIEMGDQGKDRSEIEEILSSEFQQETREEIIDPETYPPSRQIIELGPESLGVLKKIADGIDRLYQALKEGVEIPETEQVPYEKKIF